MTPFEQNLQRLLSESYQPETPDPEFVAGLEAQLRATAQERAATQAGELRVGRRRIILGSAMAAAAAVVLIALVWRLSTHRPPAGVGPMIELDSIANSHNMDRLTPRAKAPAAKFESLAIGAALRTEAGRPQRVLLPDGSTLFVNGNSSLKVESERRIVLEQGEVYVEVAKRTNDRFVVKTADREVTALGTRFNVRAIAGKTAVAVTQGMVKVSGVSDVVRAGQQLTPDADEPTVAPRVSALLEWTRELMAAESPLVPGNNYGSGKLLAFDTAGQEAKISLRKFHIDVHIEDGFARTTIDQTYFNHEHAQLEGTFYFPLPPDASISRLAMYVNGVLMEGGMAERDHARNTFEEIRYARRDPALLEWMDGSLFKMRVFPMEARQEKRIVLSYSQKLPRLNEKMAYRLPAGHDLRVVDSWSTKVRIVNDGVSWKCPSHKLSESRDGSGATILSASATAQLLDRDLRLELTDGDPGTATRFSTGDLDGQRYVMLRHRPVIQKGAKPQAAGRHHVILFETSADRDPLLARTQIEIVRTLLQNLEHADTFHLLTVGTRSRLLNEKPLAAIAENIKTAIEALERVHLVGSLDLDGGLAAAASIFEPGDWLIHVGGGNPAIGQRRDDELVKRIPADVRYAGIGVGQRWNRAFMRAAAERTGGHYTQINPDEPVAWKAFDFLAGLRLPRWQNLSIADDTGRTWLLTEASIAAGEELVAATRFADNEPMPKQLIIRGLVDGKPFEEKLIVEKLATSAGYIPRTWGKLEIDRLVAENSTANKAKIVELSKAMYVMSPFTSLLVLENDAMYSQYKIDRGRKDHWAMYDCPVKIDVKPEPASPAEAAVVANKKMPAQEVLKTIQFRNARYVWAPGRQQGLPITAADMPAESFDEVTKLARRHGLAIRGQVLDEMPDDPAIDDSTRAIEDRIRTTTSPVAPSLRDEIDKDSAARKYRRKVGFGSRSSGPQLDLSKKRLLPPNRGNDFDIPAVQRFDERQLFEYYRAMPNAFGGGNSTANFYMNYAPGFGGNGNVDGTVRFINGNPFGNFQGGFGGGGFGGSNGFGFGGQGGFGGGQGGFGGQHGQGGFGGINGIGGIGGIGGQFGFNGANWSWNGRQWREINGPVGDFGYLNPNLFIIPDNGTRILSHTHLNQGWALQRPQVPSLIPVRELGLQAVTTYAVNWQMLVNDLIAFAPGMETSLADIQAVLEAEASDMPAVKIGRIDAAARKLVDRSRAGGWRTNNVLGNASRPAFTITYDGAGRFTFTRTLATGLRETVVNDGETLWHLYPEIGVGSRRNMGRAYWGQFEAMMPDALPAIEELARDADVIAIDDRTIAIVPHGEETKKAQLRLTFDADGRLNAKQWIDVEGKPQTPVRFTAMKPAATPNLKPDMKSLVVLPMPYRTVAWVEAKQNESWWSKDPAQMLAAQFATAPRDGTVPSGLLQLITKLPANIRRPGHVTLLRSSGDRTSWMKWTDNLSKTNPGLMDYLHIEYTTSSKMASPNGLLERMWWLHMNQIRWTHQLQSFNAHRRQVLWRELSDFVERNRHNEIGWLAATLIGFNRPFSQEEWKSAAEIWQLFDSNPEHKFLARWERVQCLLKAGLPGTARMLFDDTYREALKAGIVPPVNSDIRHLPPSEDGTTWDMLLVKSAGELARQGRAADALAIAEQCITLGGADLARKAFSPMAPFVSKWPVELRFAAAIFLARVGDRGQSETILKPMLEGPELANSAVAWRLAADLAAQNGVVARKVACLERALELEFASLPEMVDVQSLRQDYSTLLAGYSEWIAACRTVDTAPPDDMAARVVKFADRWRAVDPDPTMACQSAGRVLRLLNEADLAWEYLTTPLAGRPNEAEPFRKLATELQASSDLELAQRALAAAFAAESTNAQLLWDRATLLQQMGRDAEAQSLFQQLAEGNWQPRFAGLKQQAQAIVTR